MIELIIKIIKRFPKLEFVARLIHRTFYSKLKSKLGIYRFHRLDSSKVFKQMFPQTRLYHPHEKKGFNSDWGQDRLIFEDILKKNERGFFIDVGGSHPIESNNTYFFENIGWSGIALEPIPDYTNMWGEKRKCKFLPYAVSNSCSKQVFNISKESDYVSCLDPKRSSHSELYKEDTWNQIEVEVVTIDTISRQFNIETIDYLSIDVEGHELEILEGIDFKKLFIKVISIENFESSPGDPFNPLRRNKILHNFLKDKNFIFFARMGLDDIWINEDLVEIKK